VKAIWALAFLISASLFAGEKGEQKGAPAALQSDLARFENDKKHGSIKAADLETLAGIYFLTGRCSDVKTLMGFSDWRKPLAEAERQKLHSALATMNCACGGECPGDDPFHAIWSFRATAAKSSFWHEPVVQKAWRTVSELPEAKYLAVKTMLRHRDDGDSTVTRVRQELEKSLEGMEVH
jgi:hypothetical protein